MVRGRARTGKMGRAGAAQCALPGFSGDTLALANPPRAARIVSADGRPLPLRVRTLLNKSIPVVNF